MINLSFGFPILTLAAGVIYARSSLAQTQPHVTSSRGDVPQTGSAQGVNPHNSQPMPQGMVMPTGPPAQGPMVTSPSGGVPQTGSSKGVNPHNSEPMPRGMVMPTGPAAQGPRVTSPTGFLLQTGQAQGVESPGSMPPGHMAADPNKKP